MNKKNISTLLFVTVLASASISTCTSRKPRPKKERKQDSINLSDKNYTALFTDLCEKRNRALFPVRAEQALQNTIRRVNRDADNMLERLAAARLALDSDLED